MSKKFKNGDIVKSTRTSCGVSKFDLGIVIDNDYIECGRNTCRVLVIKRGRFYNYYMEKSALSLTEDNTITEENIKRAIKFSQLKYDYKKTYNEKLSRYLNANKIKAFIFCETSLEAFKKSLYPDIGLIYE